MIGEIKLVVSENARVIETVIKKTSTQPCHLIQSLQEFQKTANNCITKIIESQGDSGGDFLDAEDEEESESDEEDIPVSPKKRKK